MDSVPDIEAFGVFRTLVAPQEVMNRDSRRILLVCSKFGRGPADRYLTNELADALVALGCQVSVVAIAWDAPPGGKTHAYTQANGVQVLETPPLAVGGLGRIVSLGAKWGGSSMVAARQAKRQFAGQDFDLLIAFSPVVVTAFLVTWALRRFRCKSYAYVVDFFPFHHRSLGVIPGGPIFKVARWAERALLARFDVVACMSRMGVQYLRQHYRISPAQSTPVLHLWGPGDLAPEVDKAAVRQSHGLPTDKVIAVFGGQITEGRGIEEILQAAALARSAQPNLTFLFVGSGRLEPLVRSQIAEGADNVVILAGMGRDRYLELVAACDIGIVCTVANVDVPTFPSKTIDYLRAGLPVAASVEATTDFGAFVEERGFGVAAVSGNPSALLGAIAAIAKDPAAAQAMTVAGRRTLHAVFAVEAAAKTLLMQVDQAS